MEFLGVSWVLKNGTLSVPQEKKNQIVARRHAVLHEFNAARRTLESLARLLNFTASLVQLGRLLLLPIIAWMILSTLYSNRDTPVPLTSHFRKLGQNLDEPTVSVPVCSYLLLASRHINNDRCIIGRFGAEFCFLARTSALGLQTFGTTR